MNLREKELPKFFVSPLITVVYFANPESIQQADMLEYLNSLSPKERTELLGELYSQWEVWRNEQMLKEANDDWFDSGGERFIT